MSQDDLDMNYDDVTELYKNGKRFTMYFGSSFGVKIFPGPGDQHNISAIFQENGEKWLMTTPYFQVALKP